MVGTAGVFSAFLWCPFSLSKEPDYSWSRTDTSVSCLLSGCSTQTRETFLSLPAQALLVCVTNWENSRQRGLEKRSLLSCFPGLQSGGWRSHFLGLLWRHFMLTKRMCKALGHTPVPWESPSWKREDILNPCYEREDRWIFHILCKWPRGVG